MRPKKDEGSRALLLFIFQAEWGYYGRVPRALALARVWIMRLQDRFTEEAAEELRKAIVEASGNEVFALGYLDKKDLVDRVRVSARGNRNAVLALDMDGGADVLIHNHPSGFLTPSDEDLLISSRAAEAGLGSFIVDNGVLHVYVVAEPVKKRVFVPLEADRIVSDLEEGIAKRLPAYECRESQLDLTRLIVRAFNEDAFLAAEAGTGVGKSFAYLLPAIRFALANDERIVISTATITLQQQLYEKDIPLALGALNAELKVVLMKGRANYLCRRRLEEVSREPALLYGEDTAALEAVKNWAETTKTGSRSDLSFMPSQGLWSQICSEADTCMGMRCPHREHCFVLSLRRECADARIIVVNHHLLFADLAARHEGAGYEGTVVLPPYNRVILDEAHTTEESATSFFSGEFSRPGIYRRLGRLYRRRQTKRAGLLLKLMGFIPGLPGGAAEDEENRIAESVEKIRSSVDLLDECALDFCRDGGAYRLTASRYSLVKETLFPRLSALRKDLDVLAAIIRGLLDRIPDREDRENWEFREHREEDALVWETKAALKRLDETGNLCGSFLEYRENPGMVMWLERRGGQAESGNSGTDQGRGGKRGSWVGFTATPLDIARSLKEALFEPNKTVICLSATLTVAGSFNYWMGRTGLKFMGDREILSGIFPSPFPYENSVLLVAPAASPLPGEGNYENFVNQAVGDLAGTAGGSALILFTSYESLKSAWQSARPLLEDQGIRCLKQGDDDRNRLLQNFLSDESSVLFATASFWEGVDAPGDTLRMVILCRLPFRSPSDPVFEARGEVLEAAGGNSFMDLSIPEAVMKFKQGFGRLMRRSSDRGVVAVLDGRLLRKRYGEFFIRSLPRTRTCFGEFGTILRETESFLFSPR